MVPVEVLKTIEDSAEYHLKQNEYTKALWKYEHCVLYIENYFPAFNIRHSRATIKCATTLVKIAAGRVLAKDLHGRLQCLDNAKMFCKECLQLGVTDYLAEAYKCKADCIAEAFELQKAVPNYTHNNKPLHEAYDCYKKSFEIEKTVSTLFKMIITCINSRSDATELMKYQQFLTSGHDMFHQFAKTIATSKQVTNRHMKFFFVKERFCLIATELSTDLSGEVLGRILETCWKFKFEQAIHRIWEHVNDKTKMTVVEHLAKNKKELSPILSEVAMSKELLEQACITPNIRTSYLLNRIEAADIGPSIVAIQSGPIKDQEKNISKLVDCILTSKTDCDLSFLKCGKDTDIKLTSTAFTCLVEKLSLKCCQRKADKKKAVRALTVLIELGANVEGLNRYSQGNKTSPLIVATHLALKTGNTDILLAVVERKSSSWVTTEDVNGNSPLQIAEQSSCECKDDVIKLLRVAGFETQEVHPSPKPEANCRDDDHVAQGTSEQPTKTSTSISHEASHNVQLTKQGSSKPKRKKKPPKGEVNVTKEASDEPETKHVSEKNDISIPDLQLKVCHLLSSKKSYCAPEESQGVPQGVPQEREQTIARLSTQKVLPQTEVGHNTPGDKPQETDKETFNFEDQLWAIEIRENVDKFLRDKAQPHKIRQQLITKLRKLASGDWNEKLHKPIVSKNDIKIFEAKLTKAARIMYQIDVRFSERLTNKILKIPSSEPIHIYVQTIIVWDVVLDHDRINCTADRIKQAIKKLTVPTHIFPFQTEGLGQGIVHPQMYVTPELDATTQSEVIKQLGQNFESKSKIQEYDVGAKMYSVTNDLILSFLDQENDRKDYPIKATDEEHDIIMLPTKEPVIVLGRSGTGKTTTCLNRLWLNFRNYWTEPDRLNQPIIVKPTCNHAQVSTQTPTTATATANERLFPQGASISVAEKSDCDSFSGEMPSETTEKEFEHLHQMFITKNPALCMKMQKRFYDFVAGSDFTKHHLAHENEALPETFSDIEHFPVFLTSRQFFTMLDRSIGDGENYLKPGVQVIESLANQADTHSLNLLFDVSDDDSDDEEDNSNEPRQKRKIHVRKEVTAHEFSAEIWPKIAKHWSDSKVDVDPILIWTEIQSFIEGSTQALETEEGFLSEEDYIKLGTKQASNFPFRREEVYKLFKKYKHEIKHRNMSHQFDNSEFIWQLNKRLEAKGLDNIPWSIHELYIDEAQDFTQAELTVILKCCQDPNRSFLAGDTAQTIIKGISFRFEDLKSLFRGLKLPGVKCKAPSIRKLTTNHRSHSGITNLAISLTDVLKEHFRYSFDWNNIPNDHSNTRGPKPLFICSKSKLENFLIQGLKASDVSSIEFGADQVVIARNSSEEGKKTMPEYLQHEIVLNPQECKGLEFNDVLLYNFFTDTASQNEDLWRIPASYLVEHPEVVSGEEFDTDVHPIQFDETCHKSLCAELKMLYTIVTRAKRYIWIYEDSTLDKVPMFEYWYKRGLIEIVTESAGPDEHQTPSSLASSSTEDEHQTPSLLASSSTEDEHQTASSSTEDWKRQGDIYMEKRLWQQARKCYQKAGESSLQNIAHAHALEERALRAQKTDTSQFRKAAAMLIDCCELVPRKDLVHNAAICLYRAKMYAESIKLFERIQEYTFALRICKEHNSKDMVTMVRLYEKKGRYKASIKLYLGREKYEEALKQAHRCIEKGLLEKSVCYKMLKEVAYKQIKKGLQSQHHSEEDLIKFVDFIPHVSEQIHFLKQAKLYKRACELLQKHDMHRSAYRICKAQHLYAEGINIADSLGTDHAHHKHSLILTQAEYKLAKKDTDLRRQVKGDLEQFLRAYHLSTYHKARAYLLLSAILVIDNEQNCLKHCIETHAMYKTVAKSKAGEIEAFYILNEVREHTVDHGKMTVAAIEATEQICTLLEKPAAVFTPEINDIEHFYGLEKDGNELYCVSKESSYFFKFDGTEMDSDGMLRLNKKTVLRQVQEHYKQHIAKWKESIQKVKNPWETKVKRSFTFHSELLQLPYLKKAHRMFPPSQIKEYLNMTDLAIQFGQLNPSVFVPKYIIENLHRLLSPFSQISLPFKQENYVHIATLSSTKVALMEKVSKDITAMATDMETPNVDNWLQLWKIIHIMDRKRTDQLNYTIKKQEKMVNKAVWLRNGYYDPSRNSPFTYTYRKRENTYQSIFDLWDHSCKLYRGKSKALVATRISFTLFILVIARRRSLKSTFSLENLIYITTIQSTALLAMISASLFKSSQPKVMVVPESFELMINNFDLINTGSTQTGLLDACLNTSNQLSVHTILQKASELLIGIIDLLTGTYNYRYFPLNEAVCQGTDTEAIHCLVLTLTIFGNLLLNRLLPPEKVQSIFQIIVNVLRKSKDGTASQRVCLAFASCTNTNDLFQKVVHPLLRDIDLNLMLLQTVSIIGKQRIRIKSSLPSQIPTAEFKWKTPTQPDSAINSQREPKQTSQEAGTLPESTDKSSSNTGSEETYQQDQDQSNGEDRAVVDRTISLEQDESEDEDVQEELSAAAQMEYKPEPKPSEELQKEMSQCKHGNRCIICKEPVEDDGKHFEEANHKDQKTQYDQYTRDLITYNSTQGHLVEVIEKCRKNDHSNYELESMTLNAEELIRSNKEDISQVGQDCSWKQRAEKVSKLLNATQHVVANLDKKHKETFEQQKANTELSDEDRSEEDEKTTEVLSKVKLTSKRRTKIRKN